MEKSDESYMKKHQNFVSCSFGYKLVCVDDIKVKYWRKKIK